jgi:hypothetical protein
MTEEGDQCQVTTMIISLRVIPNQHMAISERTHHNMENHTHHLVI